MRNLFSKNIKRFKQDESGVAALEFVLIFPLLMLVLLGSVELYGHFRAVRKISNVTASLADIVAQSRALTRAQLTALHPLTESLLAPLDVGGIRYRIAIVRQGNAGTPPRLSWEFVNGGRNSAGKLMFGGSEYKATKCGKFKNPQGKNFPPNQDSVFVVVNYTYDSIFSNIIDGPTDYEEDMISIPRLGNTVTLSDVTPCT